MDRNQKEEGKNNQESNQLTLKSVYDFFYKCDREKDCVFYTDEYEKLPPNIKNARKTQRYFLDTHFGEYLVQQGKTGASQYMLGEHLGIASTSYTDTRSDIMHGKSKSCCGGQGQKIRNKLKKMIISEYETDHGYSKIVADIEKANAVLLQNWNLDVNDVKRKLSTFIKRMSEENVREDKLIPMSVELRQEILSLIQVQVDAGTTLESMAVPITWLLLTALLRGEISALKDYYRNMGEKSIQYSDEDEMNVVNPQGVEKKCVSRPPQYTNPDEIRPYTMEDIGNLRNTYVERTDLLEQLYQKMHSGSTKDKNYVYVSGIGGGGKTELARAYAYTYRKEYDEIFWFTCVDEEMPGVDQLLKDSVYAETVTPDILRQLDERCLLILDNCNSISSRAVRELHQKTGNAHLLVTTRLAGMTQIPPQHILYLREAQQDGSAFAFQVFCANYFAEMDSWGIWEEELEKRAGKENLTDKERIDIESICRFVWNHPMAVAMVAVMLRESGGEESIADFAGKCRLGFNRAFPANDRIPFGQGEEDYEEEPLEILKALFAGFPRRPFTPAEREILKLLQMVPARQMDMKMLCALLGDSSADKSSKNACRTLSSLGWIQSNGVWASMHPLISQVLELDPDRNSLDDENEFYRSVLEKWMYTAGCAQNGGKDFYFAYQLWKKSGISAEQSVLNLAVSLYLDKHNARLLFGEMYPEVTFAFTAIVQEQGMVHFLYYDLLQKKEEVFYRVSGGTDSRRDGQVKLLFLISREESVSLEFPDDLLGIPIIEIPDQFCRLNQAISALRLPSRLEVIGESAFESCIEMEGELKLPESLLQIGARAFSRCKKLSGSLIIYGNVEVISQEAFEGCGMDGDLIICEGVKAIRDSAFAETKFCGKAEIPCSVIEIGVSAFRDCVHLSRVILSDGLIAIDPGAFFNCSKLKDMELPETVVIIGNKAFQNCREWRGPLKLSKYLMFLEESTFSGCCNLCGELVIPHRIRIIKDDVFNGCEKLTMSENTFHDEIQMINKSAFKNCISLAGCLKLPEMLEEIGSEAFEGCIKIKKIIFGSKLRVIGSSAFMNCWQLLRMSEFPDTLEVIGSCAFAGCIWMKGNLKWPRNLKIVGDYAFAVCRKLGKNPELPETVQEGTDVFWGRGKHGLPKWYEMIFSKKEYHVKENGELPVPENMDKLTKNWMQKVDDELSEQVVIPDQIKIIGENVFANKIKLKKVVWSSELQEIGESAFAACESLKEIIPFPPSLLRIHDSAFAYCGSLTQIVFPEKLMQIGVKAFDECGLCGELVIPNQVEKIGKYAFRNCAKLKKIVFSKKLKIIDEGAFFQCMDLEELQMSQGLVEIRTKAFYNCFFLREIKFPEGLKIIGSFAFGGCTRLEKIYFPKSLEKIGAYAFYENKRLSDIPELPKSLQEIEQGAFSCCSGLEGELIIPAKVKKVGRGAFDGCHFSQIIIKNPHMEMECMFEDRKEDNPVIWGYEDSTAFDYALKYGCPFRNIAEWPGFDR